ncbi:hypothetical protein PC129_g12936 [Phytophthora cactorum]|uniref:Uncharacterized protein n=1 Tax=Phytophthora cactorum TaxID=29920 RepID=A0A8T1DPB8_9STRA|nr:hypothetical protein Pcac1_g15974 [Phytophthora cactorum]KAG2943174.1 hypothetical protein PC117_g9519 [Phytophthora cactorum]KAG3216199.1 hypothetical protein PC129_g12936 [Phytophthora cactorum]
MRADYASDLESIAVPHSALRIHRFAAQGQQEPDDGVDSREMERMNDVETLESALLDAETLESALLDAETLESALLDAETLESALLDAGLLPSIVIFSDFTI